MKKKIGIHFIPYVVLMAVLLLCMVLTAGKVSASDFSDGTAEEGKYIEEDQDNDPMLTPDIVDFKINNENILGYNDLIKISFRIKNIDTNNYGYYVDDEHHYMGSMQYTCGIRAINVSLYADENGIISGCFLLDSRFAEGVYKFDVFAPTDFNRPPFKDFPTIKNTNVTNSKFVFCEECKNGNHRIQKIDRCDPTCTEKGRTESSYCRICEKVILKGEDIPATGHEYGEWKLNQKATIYKKSQYKRTCLKCQYNEYSYGEKLSPSIKASQNSITMNTNQKNSKFKIYYSSGDKVTSWKSSNNKIFKVTGKTNGSCIITSNNPGKAYLSASLQSGLTKKIPITVKPVKTKKIYGVKKNITIKSCKKYTLKPKLSPLYSSDKIIYSSNNKKVVAVNSKGVITARKKGTAYITIKSGSKYVKCKITVK